MKFAPALSFCPIPMFVGTFGLRREASTVSSAEPRSVEREAQTFGEAQSSRRAVAFLNPTY